MVSEVGLPVTYDGVWRDCGKRSDLRIDASIIVDFKSVEHVAPVHKAQLLTFLKLANRRVGLLVSFNTPVLRDGIFGVINSPPPCPPRRKT